VVAVVGCGVPSDRFRHRLDPGARRREWTVIDEHGRALAVPRSIIVTCIVSTWKFLPVSLIIQGLFQHVRNLILFRSRAPKRTDIPVPDAAVGPDERELRGPNHRVHEDVPV